MVYNKFEDIVHMPLRVYNRSVNLFNLMEDLGKVRALEYLNLFSKSEQTQIFLMNQYIKVNGMEAAYKFATNGLEVTYTADEE